MRRAKSITLAVVFCSFLASCIKSEAPNSEADILACIVPREILKADPMIENKSILIMVNKGTNVTAVAPEFKLTPGATIEPASGTARNFTTPQEYIVTSEDKKWSKTYKISFTDDDIKTIYHFEDTLKRNKYYIFAEKENNKVIMEWASGNGGFAITGAADNDKGYPTLQSDNGYKGKCLELITRSTGSFGASVGMPMAAGNLFMGKFDALSALANPLKATKLGLPFTKIPTYITGYYKYKAGAEYTENGKVVPGKQDTFDIFAIFYETDETTKILDGTNKFTHENVYSIARISNRAETANWTKFTLPFITRTGKSINTEKLLSGKYNIALVFSSSIDGDKFYGAVGSTLLIDEVELLYNTID